MGNGIVIEIYLRTGLGLPVWTHVLHSCACSSILRDVQSGQFAPRSGKPRVMWVVPVLFPVLFFFPVLKVMKVMMPLS